MQQSERIDICIAVTLALILALACVPELKCKTKTALIYPTPDFWTHINTYHCKLTSPTSMHCEVDIEFAGYSVKPPETDQWDLPKKRFELKQ